MQLALCEGRPPRRWTCGQVGYCTCFVSLTIHMCLSVLSLGCQCVNVVSLWLLLVAAVGLK